VVDEGGVEKLDPEVFLMVLKALGNPIRLRMLAMLSKRPLSVYDLAKALNLSYPLTFLHLKQLKKASLVKEVRKVEKHGPLPAKYYLVSDFNFSLTPEFIRKLFE
jgi:DNA-binding transcriptional ArsR family regulator